MRTEPSRLEVDIGNHFQQQLRLLLQDTADTCERGDMGAIDTMVLMLSVLMCETSRGGIALRMSEEAFADLARLSHKDQTGKMKARKRRK